jgi:uncharacterized coiled-coil DUF342 family protein
MPRPQRYTDSEIVAAAQALIAEGGEINPMRVRMRLGGGNVSRIKAVIAKLPRREPPAPLPPGLPQTLVHELQQVAAETSQQILSVVTGFWASALAESAGSAREETARLRQQVERLELEARASSARQNEAETQREEMDRAAKKLDEEKADLAQNLASLKSALRNAESDFRAAQRMIDSFERNRREDRDEIRNLQKRIEALVGEIATLKAKVPGRQQKARANSSGSRLR